MASREKVGNSVSEFLQDMSEYELTCPICFEEFKEPKSLPNCAHSVCLQCLQKMSDGYGSSYGVFECPVCRIESPIPSNGVKAWPTNSRIVRLMDRFPGRQDKLAIKTAVENCRKACEASSQRDEQYRILSERVKKEVEEKAQRLVEFIRGQERSLLGAINDVVVSECSKNPELRGQATELTKKAEDIVERGDVYEIVDAKENLVSQMDEITKELQPTTIDNFADLLREQIQGEKQLVLNTQSAPTDNNNVCNYFDPKFSRLITKSKDPDRFYPFDVAMSSSRKVVVLDSRFQNVSIFDENGVLLDHFKVGFEDLWGMVVSTTDDIIIISNGVSDDGKSCGYLLYYDIKGNFTQKKTIDDFKDAFLTGISLDDNNNFVITSGIFTYSKNQLTKGGFIVLAQDFTVKFSTLGSEKPDNMRKGIFYKEKYYCTSLIEPGKKGCVKVFDNNGKFLQDIGQAELCDPHGLTVDQDTSSILVCDRQLHAILLYNMEGNYLTRFNTKDDPLQILISPKDKDIFVACYLGLCVQVISYKWFLEVTDKSMQALKWIA